MELVPSGFLLKERLRLKSQASGEEDIYRHIILLCGAHGARGLKPPHNRIMWRDRIKEEKRKFHRIWFLDEIISKDSFFK